MNKAELVNAIAEKAGFTKVQAKNAIEAFMDVATDSL
jgi:nucleoid DNA-binding protein